MNSSTNQNTAAVKGGSSATPTPANTSNYRRSSQDQSSGMFSNLTSLKRNSQDATTEARRKSLSEQTAKPGFIGKMWNDFTRGTNSNSK